MTARRRSEPVIGRLATIAALSALAWWGLSLTGLPPHVVAWLSGAVAGWIAALAATRSAGRKVAAATKTTTTRKRSR